MPEERPALLRDMIEGKRTKISANKADLRRTLRRAPDIVRTQYARCKARIRTLFRLRKPGMKIDAVLYPAARNPVRLTGSQLTWLLKLLSHPANGWDVSLSKPLKDGDEETKLLFRFDPQADQDRG